MFLFEMANQESMLMTPVELSASSRIAAARTAKRIVLKALFLFIYTILTKKVLRGYLFVDKCFPLCYIHPADL